MLNLPLKTAFAVLAISIAPVGALAGPNGDCTCRHTGGDTVEGQTACIKTAKGMMLARCERVLNNTSWTFLNQPCPVSALTPRDPAFHLLALFPAG
ncbi:MAG: hypothetical protein WBO55_01990 [Rhizobiaceae bacterium]